MEIGGFAAPVSQKTSAVRFCVCSRRVQACRLRDSHDVARALQFAADNAPGVRRRSRGRDGCGARAQLV